MPVEMFRSILVGGIELVGAKEGEEVKCALCGDKLTRDIDRFWTILKWEKLIPTLECPKCGKTYTVEEIPELDRYEIKKDCTCTLELTREALEAARPKWVKTVYAYCDTCFKEAFGNILFAHLGEDNG